MPERQINIQVPFQRLDATNRMVYGYASTGKVDTYGTSFDPGWWPHAVSGYLTTRLLSEMHDEDTPVGTVPIFEVREEGIWIGARIDNAETWRKIEEEEYNGFSIAGIGYEGEEFEEDGNICFRFTKYILRDITVGYPAANLDSRFLHLQRLATSDAPWDFDWTKDADNIIAALGWEGLAQATLYRDPQGEERAKETYQLPVAKMVEARLTIHRYAVQAAMAVLNGARGDQYTPETRTELYAQIKKLYSQFGDEAPELHLASSNEGDTMSKLTEGVLAVMKRLTGKEPDASTKAEVEALEKATADAKDAEIVKLTETITSVEKRLAALEEPPKKDGETNDKTAETVTALLERLTKLENRIAKSKQPGDDGALPGGIVGDEEELEPGMNNFIRIAASQRGGAGADAVSGIPKKKEKAAS